MRSKAPRIAERRRGRAWPWLLLAVLAISAVFWRTSAAGGAAPPAPGDGSARDAGAAQDLRARLAALEGERDALRAELEVVTLELGRERAQRIEREEEWLRYTSAIAALRPERAGELPRFGPHLPLVDEAREEPAPPQTPEEQTAATRSAEVLASLRALFVASALRGIDLLEVGRVQEGFTGPAVFRLLDERGRLTGSLFAERLRLESSLSGRTLTLILEEGYESHGGERTPFGIAADGGGPGPWRIPFEDIDPAPWRASLPELFGEAPPEILSDDGRWDLAWVQVKLNQLLRDDTAAVWYRLRRLGGVQAGVLRDVHVEQRTNDGRIERRLFADRLILAPATRGVVLVFEDGVHVRGDEKTPFRDGRHRVYLPRARRELWTAEGLPGFVDGPTGPAAATPPGAGASRR